MNEQTASPRPRYDVRGHRWARLRLAAGTLTLVSATIYAMVRLLMLKTDPTATRVDILLTLIAIVSVGALGVWVSMGARQAFSAWEIWSDAGGLELRREHERIRLDFTGVERIVARPSTLLPTLTEVRFFELDQPIFAFGADRSLMQGRAADAGADQSGAAQPGAAQSGAAQSGARDASRSTQPAA